jgi:K+-sensing histidine kinase KdpD
MKEFRSPFTYRLILNNLSALLLVLAITIPLWLIGRETLGEAVIALLYLVPVTWCAFRWGQLPGISAALTAALAFDFLFIPPFFTFAVGRLEGWLVLGIFLGVAVIVVGRIQASITTAREATFMYELSSALSGVRTQEAAARILARQIQQLFQASMVRVSCRLGDPGSSLAICQPENMELDSPPDRVVPILNAWGLAGEIQIWRSGYAELPPLESNLLQNFALQAARAFERTQNTSLEKMARVG